MNNGMIILSLRIFITFTFGYRNGLISGTSLTEDCGNTWGDSKRRKHTYVCINVLTLVEYL